MPPESGVYKKDGKWLMQLDDKAEGVELPEHVARVIRIALSSERRAARSGLWSSSVKKDKINCHQTIFRAIGLINHRDSPDLIYDFALLPAEKFHKYASPHELVAGVRNALGRSIGVVQIRYDTMLTHTLLAGFDSMGRCICFEKDGLPLPFQIIPLEEIYQHQTPHARWAAGPVEAVMKSEEAKWVRSLLDRYRPSDTDNNRNNNRALHGPAQ